MSQARYGTAYITVAPKSWYHLSFLRIGIRRPREEPPPGTIVLQVEFTIPDSAFRPIRPHVDVVVPETLVDQRVEVTVADVSL